MIVVLAALLATPGRAEDPPLQTSLTPFRPRLAAPDIDLPDLDGQSISLAKLKGKVVIVNFWATWCPPCRREFASMERLRKIMADRPLAILAVNEGENVDAIAGFTATLDTPPTFYLLQDLTGDVMAKWPVRGLPTTFVVDTRGRIVFRAIGGREFDHPQMLRQLERLFGRK
ncbi:MAG: TlpA disulfide reductase family protein [Thiobacillaceae bacterium]|jgi:thiol-disulfide isomerase/thioredoxin